MRCVLLTPDGSLFEGEAATVTLPDSKGLIGILPHHAPLIGKLGIGLVTIKQEEQSLCFAVEGGFFEVDQEGISILAERAFAPDVVNAEMIQDTLKIANALPVTDEQSFAKKQAAIAKAINLEKLSAVPPSK